MLHGSGTIEYTVPVALHSTVAGRWDAVRHGRPPGRGASAWHACGALQGAPHTAAHCEPGGSMETTPPTIFVVDDDASLRQAVARLLHAWGMQVVTCASAHEFLACPLPDGPACLVLDLRLGEENGMDLQAALRSAARQLPIIFLTGYG